MTNPSAWRKTKSFPQIKYDSSPTIFRYPSSSPHNTQSGSFYTSLWSFLLFSISKDILKNNFFILCFIMTRFLVFIKMNVLCWCDELCRFFCLIFASFLCFLSMVLSRCILLSNVLFNVGVLSLAKLALVFPRSFHEVLIVKESFKVEKQQ